MQPEAQAALRRVWLKQELARYRQRSETQPDRLEVWQQLGRIYWELGEAEQTLAVLERGLALQPENGECLLGLTVAYLALNRNEEGLAASVRLSALFPQHSDALLHQIEALRRLGRLEEAVAVGERVLTLLPVAQQLSVLRGQASLLFQLNRREEALAAVDQALAQAPDDLDFQLNRAGLLYRLRRFTEALEIVERVIVALALRVATSMQVAAQCLKARILAALRRFDEADVLLDELQKDYPHAILEREFEPWRLPDETAADSLQKRYTGRGLYMARFFEAQSECDWTDWEATLADVDDLAKDALRYGFVAGMEPHRWLSLPIAPAVQLAVAQAQATAVDKLMAPIRQQLALQWTPRQPSQRLRVGYVSGDFRDHATAHLIRRLFQVHDRERFEIFGYSLRPGDGSRYWQDISGACDQFVELYGVSNAEAATRIAADGMQILVDLHGYTRFARPEIFALRPAPIQIAFLGYPGTLGADYIPYIVADRVVLPEALRPCFSEQPIYLECYQVNDDEQPIAETGLTRTAVGLPDDAFVYCCFNSTYKIEPSVFGVWMRILQQTPGSVLWLLDTPRGANHLRMAAAEWGVASERLVFAPRLPKPQHLERHRLADVFLDTFIVNAHTTASDALWAGLPVVALVGSTFQSRVCTSLLSTLGLSEWVAKDEDDYERLAVALARDPGRLRDFRAQLAERRTTAPLFMTEFFVRQLEQSFMPLGCM